MYFLLRKHTCNVNESTLVQTPLISTHIARTVYSSGLCSITFTVEGQGIPSLIRSGPIIFPRDHEAGWDHSHIGAENPNIMSDLEIPAPSSEYTSNSPTNSSIGPVDPCHQISGEITNGNQECRVNSAHGSGGRIQGPAPIHLINNSPLWGNTGLRETLSLTTA